eukprot:TRINITY_DN35324_c0_g1_i1.p1 TRINITY_DN35324_c0_g1~~TRINITY_DN35324_c0_g1_i1.p1  ORF type:complete len:549 (+),score=247.76 TRINITY_DN35324_c0_g1_i1:95-1648(+)
MYRHRRRRRRGQAYSASVRGDSADGMSSDIDDLDDGDHGDDNDDTLGVRRIGDDVSDVGSTGGGMNGLYGDLRGGAVRGRKGDAAMSDTGRTALLSGQQLLADRPHLISLWSYGCAESDGRTASCMGWNEQNSDLLASGYGAFTFGADDEAGLVHLWSPKNPMYPERTYHTKSGVVSLDFGSVHPHLLAIGMKSGSVAIYDVRDRTERPSFESQHSLGKHSEPVWGVKWVRKGVSEGDQRLVSISSDSTVCQWSMKKGLVPHEIMQLKRIPNRANAPFEPKHAETISRQASGLCFDFPSNDESQYYTGTEDGIVHKCSVSYNEQTLENYFGHTGPVYQVRCSPFLPDAFLTCSADWTSCLWTQKITKPMLVFESGKDYVTDVRWSPVNSCVFGTVSRDGRCEIWDLDQSPHDPVISHKVTRGFGPDKVEPKLSSVLFSPVAPVIMTGSEDGRIDVFRVNGVDLTTEWSRDEQVNRLDDAIYEHSNVDYQGSAQVAGAQAVGAAGADQPSGTLQININ